MSVIFNYNYTIDPNRLKSNQVSLRLPWDDDCPVSALTVQVSIVQWYGTAAGDVRGPNKSFTYHNSLTITYNKISNSRTTDSIYFPFVITPLYSSIVNIIISFYNVDWDDLGDYESFDALKASGLYKFLYSDMALNLDLYPEAPVDDTTEIPAPVDDPVELTEITGVYKKYFVSLIASDVFAFTFPGTYNNTKGYIVSDAWIVQGANAARLLFNGQRSVLIRYSPVTSDFAFISITPDAYFYIYFTIQGWYPLSSDENLYSADTEFDIPTEDALIFGSGVDNYTDLNAGGITGFYADPMFPIIEIDFDFSSGSSIYLHAYSASGPEITWSAGKYVIPSTTYETALYSINYNGGALITSLKAGDSLAYFFGPFTVEIQCTVVSGATGSGQACCNIYLINANNTILADATAASSSKMNSIPSGTYTNNGDVIKFRAVINGIGSCLPQLNINDTGWIDCSTYCSNYIDRPVWIEIKNSVNCSVTIDYINIDYGDAYGESPDEVPGIIAASNALAIPLLSLEGIGTRWLGSNQGHMTLPSFMIGGYQEGNERADLILPMLEISISMIYEYTDIEIPVMTCGGGEEYAYSDCTIPALEISADVSYFFADMKVPSFNAFGLSFLQGVPNNIPVAIKPKFLLKDHPDIEVLADLLFEDFS